MTLKRGKSAKVTNPARSAGAAAETCLPPAASKVPFRPTGQCRAVPAGGLSRAAALALGISVFALFSCDLFTYKRPFADAYYENNFIENVGFDNFVGADGPDAIWDPASPGTALFPDPDTSAPVPVTGSWDFAYRYDPSWEGDGSAYMTLTPTSIAGGDPGTTAADFGAVPSGLAASAPVYRLELVNLVTGGDFEGGIGSGWTADGGGTTTVNPLASGSAGSLEGASVQLSIGSSSGWVMYTIANTLTPGYSVFAGRLYLLEFLSSGNDLLAKVCSTADTLTPDSLSLSDLGLPVVQAPFAANSSGTDVLRFQQSSETDLTLDHLTLKRNDTPLQLRLLLSRGDTNPPLESLLYKFTYWVHEDAFANGTNDFGAPYRLDTLRSDMRQVEGNSTLSQTPDPSAYSYLSSSVGWKKMTVFVNNGNLQFADGIASADPVLELIVDLDAARPGRILIAQPELRAYPDGY